ncbi:MAG: redoxin domain-containing protein, partial [Anaerococcus sp.]
MAFIGKTLPEFNLDAYDPKKDEFITVSSEDLKGKWTVLIFYPADFTFVCP